jgi:meso-butanediol dehydrogenase / (S,S)-butanediol dehydrogenase / diacetyl reductase
LVDFYDMTAEARFDFSDSVVLVTGGGSGIGLAIAQAFLGSGANVFVTGRRREPLDAFAATNPGHAFALSADVSVEAEVNRAVAETISRFDRLDIVVSNAATIVPGDLTDLSDEDWATMRAVNVDGFFYLAKAALPHLERSGGTLLAVSSVSGLAGDWGQAGYNATKGAVSNFVRSLALDWGARGVRINAVAPALTDTEPVRAITGDPRLLAQSENRVALGRIAQPNDIAPAVLFLASAAAAYITGVVLPVDGGTSASTGQAHLQLRHTS